MYPTTSNFNVGHAANRPMSRPIGIFAVLAVLTMFCGAAPSCADDALEGLAKPQEGRSMRATSTMRIGEVRRGGAMKLNPKADPKGDLDEASNWDNFTIPPGGTHVMLDEQGPGVITHIWITFLGPEPQAWAPKGSANHQEMLLRMYWDGSQRPAVEAPLGDFFASCFGKRREVVQPTGRRGQRHRVQLLLADALPQVGPHGNRQRERKTDQPALLQHRLDQEGTPCR